MGRVPFQITIKGDSARNWIASIVVSKASAMFRMIPGIQYVWPRIDSTDCITT
jgi:hypothetical protein